MAKKNSETAGKNKPGKKTDVKWTEAQRRAVNVLMAAQPPKLQTKQLADALLRAMIEPKFRKELIAKPAATLRALGVKAGKTKFRIHENDASTLHVVLPPKAGLAGPKLVLLDDDLKSGPLWQKAGSSDPVKMDIGWWADPHKRDADKKKAADPKHPGPTFTDDSDPSHADKAMTAMD